MGLFDRVFSFDHKKQSGENTTVRSGELGDIGNGTNDEKEQEVAVSATTQESSHDKIVSGVPQKNNIENNSSLSPEKVPDEGAIVFDETLDGTTYDVSDMDEIDAMKLKEDIAANESAHSGLSQEDLFGVQTEDHSDKRSNDVSDQFKEMEEIVDQKIVTSEERSKEDDKQSIDAEDVEEKEISHQNDDVKTDGQVEDGKEEKSNEERLVPEEGVVESPSKKSGGIVESSENGGEKIHQSSKSDVEKVQQEGLSAADKKVEEEVPVAEVVEEVISEYVAEETVPDGDVINKSEIEGNPADIEAVLVENTEAIGNDGEAIEMSDDEEKNKKEESGVAEAPHVEDVTTQEASNEDRFEALRSAKIYQLLIDHTDKLLDNPGIQESESGLRNAKILKLTALLRMKDVNLIEKDQTLELSIDTEEKKEESPIVNKIAKADAEAVNDDENKDMGISSASFKL